MRREDANEAEHGAPFMILFLTVCMFLTLVIMGYMLSTTVFL